MTNWVKWSNDMAGGKSRKSGGVSRALINKLLKGRKSGGDNTTKGKGKRNLGIVSETNGDGKSSS